ncbi:MAG: HIT domain-containing protein [Candidatus Cloacimonetes bacterium]|nr:HIT domain-containing protein [Candidatus Cloacimonadota bacterium]
MNQFQLNTTLNQDCFTLGTIKNSLILLLNNKHYPWFIIVPKTSIEQIDLLDESLQVDLLQQSSQLSKFIRGNYTIDKINIASIGNMVPQIHIHVIGRSKTDPSWPGVVWGQTHKTEYTKEEALKVQNKLKTFIPELQESSI